MKSRYDRATAQRCNPTEQEAQRRFLALQQAYPLKTKALLIMHQHLCNASRSPNSTIQPLPIPTTYQEMLTLLLHAMPLNDMQEPHTTRRKQRKEMLTLLPDNHYKRNERGRFTAGTGSGPGRSRKSKHDKPEDSPLVRVYPVLYHCSDEELINLQGWIEDELWCRANYQYPPRLPYAKEKEPNAD